MWDRWQKGESLGSIARLFDQLINVSKILHSRLPTVILPGGKTAGFWRSVPVVRPRKVDRSEVLPRTTVRGLTTGPELKRRGPTPSKLTAAPRYLSFT